MKQSSLKTVILVTGPTASGKTAVAIQLAHHYNTEIISADSRQCFKELNIGVARPSPHELQQVPHHFIGSHSIHEEVTAITFEQYALQKAQQLFEKHDTVVMVGGTGLYIKAFCEGLDNIPPVEPSVRENIVAGYTDKGLAWLQEQLKQKDPVFYEKGEIQNPQRLMRALEVVEGTGQSILSFRKGGKAQRDFEIVKIGLRLPGAELHQNISTRVDKMMEAGLEEEVRLLVPYKNMNALRTVGYAELFDYIDDKISQEKAVEQIKINTRQYAKRQMTWFRKDADINWFAPSAINKMYDYIVSRLRFDV